MRWGGNRKERSQISDFAHPTMSAESSSTTSTPSTLTTQEKIDRGLECKLQGNRFYKDGNVKEALSKWHESLLYCAGINSFSGMYGSKSTESENKAATRLVSDVQNNLSGEYSRGSNEGRVDHAPPTSSFYC